MGIAAVLAAILMLATPILEPYLLFLIIPLSFVVPMFFKIYHQIKPEKLFAKYLANDFKVSLQYTILEERFLTTKEMWESFDLLDDRYPSAFPELAYKNFGRRYFKVENPNGYQFELIVTIIQTWNDKFKYRIESTSRIRN